jgi:hypothetical protein
MNLVATHDGQSDPFAQARRHRLQARGEAAVRNLTRNGFSAHFLPTREEAVSAVLDLVPTGARVGFGGSLTLRELNLPAILQERGHELLNHWAVGISPEDSLRIRREQLSVDVFLTSTNAVTLQGELVNVDGVGNRVGAMMFGPGKVVVVAGANKIVRDVAAARERIRDLAAPINARRLGVPTPCAELGYCVDCDRPERICRVVTILERRPALTPMEVLIVGEELGL